MPLVLTSMPLDGESLEGLLTRLAELNAHPGPHWILQAAKLRDGFDRRVSDFQPLSSLIKAPVDRLEAMTHWPLEGRPDRLRFGEHNVQMSALALYQDRICPLCLEEFGFARQLWQLKAYAVCHIHNVALIDQCKDCGWLLRWQRQALCRCRCGAELTAASEEPSTAAIAVARRLSEVAAATPDVKLGALGALAKVIWFFGTDHGRPDWRGRFMAKPTVDQAIATAKHAAPFVFDWDAAIDAWLKEFLPAPDRELRSWILETPMLSRLKTAFHQPESEYILDAVRAHLSNFWDQGMRRRSEFCAAPRQGDYVTTTKAARMLFSNSDNVRELIAAGLLEGKTERRGKREFSTISRASIDAYLAADHWLSPSDAADHLGIPMKRLTKMHGKWGLRVQTRGITNYYLGLELDEFVETVATRVEERGPDLLSWAEVRFHNQALEMVLQGKLTAYLLPSLGSGFRGLLFDQRALAEAMPQLRYPDGGDEPLKARAAVQRLDINHNTLRELVAQGHLAGRVRGTLLVAVDLQSVVRFERQFSTARTFSRRRGLPMRDLLYRLRCSGEKPLLVPDAQKRIRAIWRLETLEALDLVKWVPPPPQFAKSRSKAATAVDVEW